MDPIYPDLIELMPDFIEVERATGFDEFGKPLGYGPKVRYRCRLVGQHKVVRDQRGNERISTVIATIFGDPGLTVYDRYTLPARFIPRRPEPIAIEAYPDENGAHHQKVNFSREGRAMK